MAATWTRVALAAGLISTIILPITADRWCNLFRTSGCSAPFVPGHHGMGDAWWAIGDRKTTILELTTTLWIPETATGEGGVIAINTAMENTDISDENDDHPPGQTFQAITASYPANWPACGQNDSQWCAFQSIYNDKLVPVQLHHTPYVKNPGQTIDLVWKYDPSAQQMFQGADTDGLSIAVQEAPAQWWPKTECQCEAKGTIPKHTYKSTKIKLAESNPNYYQSASSKRASSSDPYTTDGGTNWVIDQINMPSSSCSNSEACPPDNDDDNDQPNYEINVEKITSTFLVNPAQPT